MDGGVSSPKALPGSKIIMSLEVKKRDDDEGKGDGEGTLTSSKFSESSLALDSLEKKICRKRKVIDETSLS